MTNKSIKCPECATEIEISTVLSQQIESDLKISLQQESEKQLLKAVEDARKRFQEDSSVELDDMKAQLKEQQEKTLQSQRKRTGNQKTAKRH